jgi:tetratricopeptide (TPR) repeat protein
MESSATNKHIVNAGIYLNEAIKELSKANWFFNRINKSKAINSYIKAGESYALANDYTQSAEAYLSGLTVIFGSQELPLDYTMCMLMIQYVELCNRAKIPVDNGSLVGLEAKIIPYLQEIKSYNLIINIYETIALNYEIVGMDEQAIKYYQRAMNYADAKNMKSLLIKFLTKTADINIKNGKNIMASANYRTCAEIVQSSDLLKSNVKIWLLYSLILKIQTSTEEQMRTKIIECTNLDPKFAGSPEHVLINGLVEAYKVKDIGFINKVIVNNLPYFDTNIIKVLAQIKTSLATE